VQALHRRLLPRRCAAGLRHARQQHGREGAFEGDERLCNIPRTAEQLAVHKPAPRFDIVPEGDEWLRAANTDPM
jgi:hypothetical protein